MPVWQSSQRPMYVKTVFVDGFRHAILTHDDPYILKAKKRRPYSSTSSRTSISRISNHSEYKSVNFVVRSDKSKIEIRPERTNYNIERLNLTDVDPETEDELLIKATPQTLNENDSGRSDSSNNMKNLRLNRTSRTEAKPNTELSDRVLQWLDLAGKIDLLAPESNERMNQPRHSWPEIQRRNNIMKSRTTIDVRKDTVKLSSPKTCDAKQLNVIDRHDIYIATANTIENYARQSRNKSTPRIETKTKDNLNKTKNKEVRNNVIETRQKMVTERNAVEKQYADLVSKKLIHDGGKNSKRQVHIFIPDVPKKVNSVISSRTGSLLSHKT